VITMTSARFESLVADALDRIPASLADQMQNVVVVVEPEPEGDEDLLGEYIGVPLVDRYDYSGAMPDVIKVYEGPLLRMCSSEEEVVEEVYVTVVHEVAHHFGIDDRRLHELGWD